MSIIMYLGDNVKQYLIQSKRSIQEALSEGKLCCKLCLCEFKQHSKYPRNIKETGEQISITMVYCKNCKEYHAILPDFLLPDKQYSANEIEAVIIDSSCIPVSKIDTAASESTVRRWRRQINERIVRAISILKAVFLCLYGAISELHVEADTNYDEIVKLLNYPPQKPVSSGNILGLANIWIGKYRENMYI